MTTARSLLTAAVCTASLAGLSGWLGAGGAAAHGAARAVPADEQSIDAKAHPEQAAKTLNDLCATLDACKWVTSATVTTAYGPAQVIGDALYNCSQTAYAEDSVEITDERGESTSLGESLSAKITLGFLGLAKTSVEAEVNSKHVTEFSTSTSDENAVAVPPGYKGWTQIRVSSAYVTGDVHITNGIHLIQVDDIEFQYPGYATPGKSGIIYDSVRAPMTSDDIASRCGSVPGAPSILGASGQQRRPNGFNVMLCRRAAGIARATRGLGCHKQAVTGTPPPAGSSGQVKLTRAGRNVATGSATRAGIVLHRRRTLHRGRYTLTITLRDEQTIIPISVS